MQVWLDQFLRKKNINEQKAKIDQRGTYRQRGSLFPDDRKGLGYGVVYPTGFNEPRKAGSAYPYVEPDSYEDLEYDLAFDEDELDRFVKKINMGYRTVDSLAKNKTDPFYRVAGNTPGLGGVAEAGMHPVAKNSLVPFPGWSKKVQAVSGGYTTKPAYDERPALRTGTEQGYANRPPDPIELPDDEIKAYTLQDILDDDELSLLKARKVQSKIRKANRRGE
tara:strand:+ start:141 stop:803 length:663 start_codon:yes stop_codon:yes gene_type:complete